MNETISFLMKIIIASLIVSVMIKYLTPLLSFPPTNVNALILVMTLPLIITLFLSNKMLNKDADV